MGAIKSDIIELRIWVISFSYFCFFSNATLIICDNFDITLESFFFATIFQALIFLSKPKKYFIYPLFRFLNGLIFS